MTIDRRQLIKNGLLLAALGRLNVAHAASALMVAGHGRPKLIGGLATSTSYQDLERLTRGDQTGQVCSFDLTTHQLITLETNCAVHGYSQSSIYPSVVAGTSKWTRRGAIADFANGRVVELFAPAHQRFFGHTAFDKRGTLWACAADILTARGYLLEISLNDGKVLRSVHTGGNAPHEFLFLDDETALITNNFYKDSSLTWVNLRTEKILREVRVPRVSHLTPWMGNRYLLGSPLIQNVPGLFTVDVVTGEIMKAPIPPVNPNMGGEALSQVIVSPDLAVSTMATCGTLAFWNAKKERADLMDLGQETVGLAKHNGLLYLTTIDGALHRIEPNESAPLASKVTQVHPRFSNSRHLLLAHM